ncbi:MAG: hypothetical protein LUD15_01365 [Bacteroides sp.]|nr:hypothetical protein [Bacteroides sp.]
MKRNTLFTLLFYISILSFSQSEYHIGEVTVINLGDGRMLYREAKTDTPLNGEQRIIDGYRSEYLLVPFKDGLYHGTFRYYKNNLLVTECDYKEGLKDGEMKVYYGDGETLKSVANLVADKLHSKYIEYDTEGNIIREDEYKEENPHGKHITYIPGTRDIRSEEYYVQGKPKGTHIKRITGSRIYTEISNYKDGLLHGEYIKEFEGGIRGESGFYTQGKKSGECVKLNVDGDSLEIKTYENGELNGLSVDFFTTGERSKAYMYKNGKKDGVCIDYDNRTGKPKKIAHYKENREHGTVQVWMTSNRFNFIETTT